MSERLDNNPQQIYPISGTVEKITVAWSFNRGRKMHSAEIVFAQAWTEVDGHLEPMEYRQVAKQLPDGTVEEFLTPRLTKGAERLVSPLMGVTEDGRETVDTRATGLWVRRDKFWVRRQRHRPRK